MIDVYHEDAILITFILVVQSEQAILKYADAHLYRKVWFSVVKLIVLRVLAFKGGCMTPCEIAEWTRTERHNIGTMIGRMKRDGLARTEHNPKNKGFMSLSLTDKGREVIRHAMPVAREIVDQVMYSVA